MSALKDQILNLFQDNQSGDITPADIRTFVNAIFDSTQENIPILDSKVEIVNVPNVSLNDLIVVTGSTNVGDKGLYVATSNAPTANELLIISNPEYVKTVVDQINSGQSGQILYTDDTGLYWGEAPVGHRIIGSENIQTILSLRPQIDNVVYIALNSEPLAIVPGLIGDGYIWDLLKRTWTNIGQLRGTQGLRGPSGHDSTVPGPKGDDGDPGLPSYDLQGRDTAENILNKPHIYNDAWIVKDLWNTSQGPINDEQARPISDGDVLYCTDAYGTLAWVTIGPLGVNYATQDEVDNGCTNGITGKALSPETFCNSVLNGGTYGP